jgi:hypothetical protein
MADAPVIVTYQRLNEMVSKAGQEKIVEALKTLPTLEADEPPVDDQEAAELMQKLAEAMKEMEKVEHVPGILAAPDDQFASVVQSRLAQKSLKAKVVGGGTAGALEAQFDEHDVLGWAKSLLTWYKKLKPHQWQAAPAAADPIPSTARVAVLGDWGSGLYGAPVCASSIQNDAKDYQVLLHLGDVYYSGTKDEIKDRFLNLWPKKPSAISRACNANHEMYTGGYGYFDLILKQFNQPASYFALQNDHWLLVGLDSAYKEWELVNDQVAWLTNLIASAGDRRVVLFSHHQLFSWADKAETKMQSQLAALLNNKKIFAWYWGHEHRCVIYDQHPVWDIYGRCIGHSGYPYFRDKFKEGTTVQTGPQDSSWRKVDTKNMVPGALILEGPNPYIPGHADEYGPNGYVTLELDGEHLKEIVQMPDSTMIYEKQLI